MTQPKKISKGIPHLAALLNDWWFESCHNTVDSPGFKQEWAKWTEGDSEAMTASCAPSLVNWWREHLEEIAKTQVEGVANKPKRKM